MKGTVFFSVLIGIAALRGAQGQSSSAVLREGRLWVRTIKNTLPASESHRVHVITEGNVTLSGAPGNSITYSVTARVKASNQHEAEQLLRDLEPKVTASGDIRTLVFKAPGAAPNGDELSVTVPANVVQAWVETLGGNVEASGLEGELRAESAGGRIRADRINGSANLKTGGGDVTVGRVNGPVHCYSGGGSIQVDSAGGESWFETAGGEISIHETRGAVHANTGGGNIRVDRSGGAVYARTAGGLIQVQQSAGAVVAESSGGAIQVNAAQSVTCESAGGAIRLRNIVGALRATTAAGSILAELLSGNHLQDSVLSTNAGDITVLISSKIPVTIQARNDSGGMTGRIISDFPEIRPKPLAPGIVPVVAEGSLNGGGPVLRIVATGGTIYLRREH